MQVLVNSDHNITGTEALTARVESVVQDALGRFDERLTRVEVHLNDENSIKAGAADKRVMMEARLKGQRPIAVTAFAATLEQAIDEAADKLERALDHTVGRLDETAGGSPPEDQVANVEDLGALGRAERRDGAR